MVDICGSIGHGVQGDEPGNSWRPIGIRFFVLFVVVVDCCNTCIQAPCQKPNRYLIMTSYIYKQSVLFLRPTTSPRINGCMTVQECSFEENKYCSVCKTAGSYGPGCLQVSLLQCRPVRTQLGKTVRIVLAGGQFLAWWRASVTCRSSGSPLGRSWYTRNWEPHHPEKLMRT